MTVANFIFSKLIFSSAFKSACRKYVKKRIDTRGHKSYLYLGNFVEQNLLELSFNHENSSLVYPDQEKIIDPIKHHCALAFHQPLELCAKWKRDAI
jgi:hypothetical protein